MVHFADYIYTKPASPVLRRPKHMLPGKVNGKWTYFEALGRHMDKDKFEGFKSRFYELEGWETATGYPKRSTLESMGLRYVADELEKKDRLGA
jgi:aldehyde:ferredoxin oxidoreductase